MTIKGEKDDVLSQVVRASQKEWKLDSLSDNAGPCYTRNGIIVTLSDDEELHINVFDGIIYLAQFNVSFIEIEQVAVFLDFIVDNYR